VQLYSAAFGALMELLSILDTLSDAMAMQAEGTLFGPSQQQAEQIERQAEEAKTRAEAITDEVSLLAAVQSVTLAEERNDDTVLMSLSGSLSDMSISLSSPAEELGRMARDLDARSRALAIMADLNRKLVSVPQGPSTAGNAHAFAMYVSLEKLSNTLRPAAEHYAEAATLLSFYGNYLGGLASRANDDAWALIFARIARIQHEMDAEAAKKPPATSDLSHAPTPGTLRPSPTPRTFPTLEEQRRTVCPNCHRPVEKSEPGLLNRMGGFGTGPGGQMTPDDYRKLKEWMDASSSQQR
jgi:hypothetical protein